MTDNPLKALLTEIQKVDKRRIKKSLTWEALGEEIQNAANGGTPAVDEFVTGSVPLPVIPQEWPKLLVDYGRTGGVAQEYAVINNFFEWSPIHNFYVRPMTELPALKAAGVKERLKEDWARRKESVKK